MSFSQPVRPPRLFDELKKSRGELTRIALPAVLLTAAAFGVAFYFVEPPPPAEIVIATGPATGNYYATGKEYAHFFEQSSVKLTVRETAGAVQNYELLADDASVRVAIVQGGTAPETIDGLQLESLCTLYLEPLWVFHRRGLKVETLSDLRGKRIAVGEEGSGTQKLAETLLNANGVPEGDGESAFIRKGQSVTIEMLLAGDVDAAFFVLAAKSPVIRDLLDEEPIELMSFERADAYAQTYPFLEHVVLPRGSADLQRDLPRKDVHLIAAAANLVAAPGLHDAFIPLFLEAATETHQSGGLLSGAGDQPSFSGVEFKPNSIARHYMKNGPSQFQKYLGFWLSSLIDRAKILLLPLVILLIPLMRLAPPVYRWRIRSRIYRWYGVLREIDQLLRNASDEERRESAMKLNRIELELEQVNVPLSYMEEFFHLHLHIDLIKRRLADLQSGDQDINGLHK